MQNLSLRISAIISLPTILLTLSLPVRPAAAANEFSACVSEIIGSGVPADLAGVACSDALEPEELSECVSDIRAATPIEGQAALTACYRVRRPVDMAECVVDIHAEALQLSPTQANKSQTSSKNQEKEIEFSQETIPTPPETEETTPVAPTESPAPTSTEEPSASLLALDSCRRSLLPTRHSECVIGLSQNVPDLSPTEAIATCLSAEDFPRELFPAFTEN